MDSMIKILLVEDDLSLSKSVYDFLKSFAQVKQVYDGVEGLYEAELGIYDLILLDLMLPEKNGFEVLKELREQNVDTPVLIMTAKESLDDKMHGFDIGADDYLTKPFYLDELKARIQALLKRTGKLEDSKEQIFDRIWGYDSDTTVTVVEVYMSKIRKKLKDTEFVNNLSTLRNVGYILR